jgi:hypothetical protein
MSNSQLISFFNEATNFTEFERRKKIYELTNNLEIDLLYDLKKEYVWYIHAVKLKTKLEKDIDYERNLTCGSRELELFERGKVYIETFLSDNRRVEGKDDIGGDGDILDIIQDLINRKMSDLPKNSRHKNNFSYYLNFEESDEMDLYAYDEENHNLQQSDELIDLSNNSVVGKIIYLEKLGVIDYLRNKRPFNTSVNSIATVLSAITGAKATTIQPLLNPLLNKDVYNKNNPLNSKKNVHTIGNILLGMGVELNKIK